MDKPLFVRRDDMPLRWHEAVAMIRGVTDALEDGRLRSVPAAHELALESDGALHLTPRAATTAADREQVVTQLRELLGGLLAWDAPPQLRALADRAQNGSPVSTLADFRQALAFFERPTLDSDRRALAARLGQIEEEHQVESEVERLRRKAQEEHKPPAEKKAIPPSRRKSFRKALVVVAIVLGTGMGVGIAMFSRVAIGTRSAAASEGHNASSRKGIIERLREAAGSAFGTATRSDAKVVSAEKTVTAAPRPARRSRAPLGSPSRPQASPGSPAPAPVASLVTQLRVLPTRIVHLDPPDLKLPQNFGAIFSGGDFDVHPPVLMRPHLPTVGSVGLPGEHLGAVDIIVDANGRVEQVRLVRTTAERRYYDAMILAAVKAWVFRPAIKAGQTVRYQLQIPLT